MNLIFEGGTILTPEGELHRHLLYVRDSFIEGIIPAGSRYRDHYPGYAAVDLKGLYVSPGFIDIHTHGGMGADASTGPYEAMAEFHLKHGTTGFLPTFWNHNIDSLASGFRNVIRFMEQQHSGSRVLGINSEGPFLNPDRGAQHRNRKFTPDRENLEKLLDAASGNLKIMTLSSDVEGYENLVRTLRTNGTNAALGYCSASPPRLHEVLELGVNHIDHIFNCFSDPLSAEAGVKPWGIEEEMLSCDELAAEVIADAKGIHVPPVWLNILYRCKGPKGIILISDSRDPAGLSPGRHTMADGMEAVTVEGEDVVRLASGSLAGTCMGLDDAVRNMRSHTGISLHQAAAMASANPASALGIENHKGSLKKGMDADLTVFDEKVSIAMTVIGGRIEYVNPSSGLQLPGK